MKNIHFDLGRVGGKVTLDGQDLPVRKAVVTAEIDNFTTAVVELVAVDAVINIALTEADIDQNQIVALNEALAPFGYEVVKKPD